MAIIVTVSVAGYKDLLDYIFHNFLTPEACDYAKDPSKIKDLPT
jgi:hypothetical protein